MSTEHKDPFADNDGFGDFGQGDDGFGREDEFGRTDGPLDEFDTPVAPAAAAEPAPEAQAPAKAKPAKEKKAKAPSGAAKPFIKTPLGIAGIAFAVAMAGFIGYKGLSSSLSGSEEPQIVDVVPEAVEPVIGNMAGLAKPQASPEVVQAVQNPMGQVNIPPASAPVEELQAPESVSASELKDLKQSIESLQEQTSEMKALLQNVNRTLDRQAIVQGELISAVRDMKADLAKKPEPAPVVIAPSAPAVTVTAGQAAAVRQAESSPRQRMAGLQVIESSQGGAMSIIKKASNGRVFTLFKGEVINWGGVRSQVTSIEKDGDLVLVGDKYFIDKVLEAPKAPVKAAQDPAPERKVVAAKPAKPAAPKNADGYTLNAVYNGKSAFGIVNNKGEFKSYKIGEKIDNLGVVTGLDEAGNLKVGNTVIRSVY